MAFKMKGFSAHKGVKSSPLNMAKPDYPDIDGDGNRKESMKKAAADKNSPMNMKHKSDSPMYKYKSHAQRKAVHASKNETSPLNKVEDQVDIRDTRDKKRLDKAVKKGNQKRIDRIGERMSKRANKRKEGKTQVAPTSIPVNDKSMKNYNKAVDERVGKKIDTPKKEVKVDASSKVVTPKVTKVTPKPVKTLRGTGKTYKSAWEGMSAEKKAGFKGGYSEFETKAKAYNKAKDIKEGTKLKEGTQGPTKPYKNPKKQKGPLNKKHKY